MPAWFGPPQGTLPGVAPVERVIVQTDELAVCVGRLGAYPAGFEFEILVVTAPGAEEADPMLFEHRHRARSGRRELPPELLRFGIQFSDGSKATTTSGDGFPGQRGTPKGPVLTLGSGGGGGGSWAASMWVWPLPPPGEVRFVCEWPAKGIALTHIRVDAQVILDAAAHAQVIFSDRHLPEWPDDDDDGRPEFAIIR